MTHLAFERISELAELGDPTPNSSDARHLADCAECRETHRRVRELLASAHALPRDVAPPPEVWSGIRDRVHRDVPATQRRAARQWHTPWLAVAATIVVVVGASLLAPKRGKSITQPPPVAAIPAVATVEQQFAPALEELRATLATQRAKLASTTTKVVDQSLADIDTAIAETRDALASDPRNEALVDILSAHYERKVEFLQRATELAAPSL